MAKARSPQYPAIGLKEAIDKVRGVYESDYQNAIPRELVAEHMGYQSLNGKSLGVLSALMKFGLLEGRGSDTRVSNLAVRIIAHPPGTQERAAAIKEAASNPELFKELDEKFPGKVSDQAIRSYLMTQKFIPVAADAVIRSYRETKLLVEADVTASAPDLEEPSADMNTTQAPEPEPARPASPPPPVAAQDPYYFSFKPSVGFEGGFRLSTEADFDALIRVLKGFKTLYQPVERITLPADEADSKP